MGKNMAQVRREVQSRVPRLETRAVGGNGPRPDPIAEAIDTRKEMLGGRILEGAQREVESDIEARGAEQQARVAEARAKLAEAQMRLRQLENAVGPEQPSTQPSSDMMVLISEMLDTLKGQNAAMQQRMDAMQEQVFTGQVQALQQQIADLKQEILGRAATGATTQDLGSKIEEVKQAQEALAPFFGQAPQLSQTGGDINTLLLIHRIQSEHEVRLAEIRGDQEDRRFQREMDWEKLRVEKNRTETLANTLNRLGPTIAKLADNAISGRGIGQAGSASVGTSSQQVPCQKVGPAGERCEGVVEVMPGQEVAQCPVCQTQYQIGQPAG